MRRADGPPTLVARGLVKTYRVGDVDVPALRGIDLELRPDEITVMLGASGSGKSTLLHLLGGLDVPSEGSVLFRGADLSGLDDAGLTRHRREHVGFVFQGYNLLPSLTALENVELVTEIAPAGTALPAGDCLALVGLDARRDHFPAQLSGGEQQRVAIARAVAKRPGLLLCDEPTGALDAATGVRVLETLLEAQRAVAATLVVITHNAVIAAIADRVIRLSGGRIAEDRRNPVKSSPSGLSW